MTTEEILKRIEEEKNNLVKLRFLNKLKQLTNTSSIKNTKKAIARMYSELSLRKKGELNK
jgi:large subunit ribosomal protein L29